MRDDRRSGILRSSLTLVALAALLVLLGLWIAGPAPAAASSPRAAAGAATPSPAPSVERRGAEVRVGDDVVVPAGVSVPSVVAFGGDVTVDGRVDDAVVAFGGDVRVTGSVGQTVVAFGGDVTVSGTVGATVVVFGGDVRLTETAAVGLDGAADEAAVVLVRGRLHRSEGAQVHGPVQRSSGVVDWGGVFGWGLHGLLFNPLLGPDFVGWLVQTAFFLVLALVAAALMPGQLQSVGAHLARRPWASLGWGALTLFLALPGILVVLVVSIIGLLLVLPYVVFVLLVCFFVTTAVATMLAQKGLTRLGARESLMAAVAVGVVATTAVSRIPAAGPVVVTAMTAFGAGAALLGLAEWRQSRREAEAARAAAAVEVAEATEARGADITPIVQTSPATQGALPEVASPLMPQSPPTPPTSPEPPSATDVEVRPGADGRVEDAGDAGAGAR